MAEYQVIVYGWITADTLEEAEEMYADNQWDVDYHVLEDESGRQFDQWDIEELSNVNSTN
jgi:SNF2 family DNA or RNA helicase